MADETQSEQGTSTQDTSTQTPQQSSSNGSSDITAQAKRMLERYNNDAILALVGMHEDNRDAREKARRKDAELAEALKRVPPEDALVLTGDQVKLWSTYQELGEPDKLQENLMTAEQALKELNGYKRQESIRKAAGDRYHPQALADELPQGAVVEAVEKDGETSYVVKNGEEITPLETWVEERKNAKPYITFEIGQQQEAANSATRAPARANPAPTGAGNRQGSTKPTLQTVDEVRQQKLSSGDYYL